MELRDKIINEMVEAGIGDHELIFSIISDAFKNINSATKTNSTVEVTGLGTFIFSAKKSAIYSKMLKDKLLNTKDLKKREYITETINYIDQKLNEQADRDTKVNP